MKYWLPVFVLLHLSFCFKAIAQQAEIKGTVVDTGYHEPLYRASVVLLQAKDSFIVASTRTDSVGRFLFNDLEDTAKYILLFSYPKYTDHSYFVNMRAAVKDVYDIGQINMIRVGILLKEVIIRASTSSIKIRGDTTEYIADSFKVQPNATVEDLLKQLPGLQVDQFGNITAQGKKVKKVLVDGEEFFSDDPTLVTRNLRADMISSVQVYDKKSDAATFTGIDDGIRDKTINLKLKEDKKHGLFGKAEVGGGTDHHYIGQGMLNAFKGNRKIAVYGTTSNIGRVGLGSADKQAIGIGDNSGDNGDYNGEGIPKSIGTGAHYDNKWNEGKESVNGNYKYNWIDVQGKNATITQNNLPAGFIRSKTKNAFDTRDISYLANGNYKHKFDTTSTITLYADGSKRNKIVSSNGSGEVRRDDSSLINDNTYTSQNAYEVNTYNLNLSWEKKLKKYGRTISFYFNNNFNHDQSDGTDHSESRFYKTENIQDSSALLHLAERMNDNWRTNSLNINYTEPLSKDLSLLVNYNLENDNVEDDKRSYNLAASTDKDLIDSLFSTKMDESDWSNQAGITFNYNPKKFIIKVGNNIQFNTASYNDHFQTLFLKKRYVNWNPTASLRYNPTQLEGFYFEYNGNTTNPGRTQLFAYKYNNSQLVTYLPNIDLRNSFTHTINSNYYQVMGMGQTYMGGSLSLHLTTNPIVLSSMITPNGAYTYQYENLSSKDNSSYGAYMYYGRSLSGWNLQSNLGINGGTMFSKINAVLNKLNYSTYSLTLYSAKEVAKRYGISFMATGGYTNNKSSLQLATGNSYFFYTLNPSAAIYFFKKLELHTDANYFWQQKTQTFAKNFDRTIWNAWLGYNMLKNDQLTIKISCNDILNQNNGYFRSANNSVYTETTSTTIRRFFMIGIVWSFTKFNSLKE